jgi:hypothetical protein
MSDIEDKTRADVNKLTEKINNKGKDKENDDNEDKHFRVVAAIGTVYDYE